MATAQKDFDPATFDPDSDLLAAIEHDLRLLALVGIVDPPRIEARDAITKAHSAGIQVRMITGDHAITAGAIAKQLGIRGRAITGAEFAAFSDEEADRQIDDIGVIARVAPEDKVRLVQILRRKGHIVAMTGDGVNDAPALKAADIGVAMGITGTEVSKEAAVMILTDDNFATIVKAVEQGRALYDNLMRYIRFQMASLFGFISTFLGASIFNVLGGVPFLPLQTLWINFTVTVFQAVGLGYSKPRTGLMEDAPRPKDAQILPRPLFLWLAFIGLVFAAVTLPLIVWAGDAYDEVVAHTMGLVTFSLFHILFSLETADEDRTIFSSQLLENPTLLKASALSLLTVFLATTFGPLQRLLDTTELSVQQWAITIEALVSAAFILISSKDGDLIGRKKAYVLGLLGYAAGALAMVLAEDLRAVVIFWAILGGLGASLLLPSMQSLIHGNFEGAAQKKVYALVGASAAIAAAVGPLLGGFITTYLSWRLGFALEVVIIAIVLSGIGRVRDVPYTGPRHIDTVGSILSVLGMGGIVLGVLVWQEGGEAVGVFLAVGAVALGSLSYWLVHRKRDGKPTLIDPDLFRSKMFRFGVTGQMMQQIALGGAMIALPIFLQMVLEYNAMQTGLSIAPLSLTMFGVALLAGKKAGTRRPSAVIRAGFALLAVGMTVIIAI